MNSTSSLSNSSSASSLPGYIQEINNFDVFIYKFGYKYIIPALAAVTTVLSLINVFVYYHLGNKSQMYGLFFWKSVSETLLSLIALFTWFVATSSYLSSLYYIYFFFFFYYVLEASFALFDMAIVFIRLQSLYSRPKEYKILQVKYFVPSMYAYVIVNLISFVFTYTFPESYNNNSSSGDVDYSVFPSTKYVQTAFGQSTYAAVWRLLVIVGESFACCLIVIVLNVRLTVKYKELMARKIRMTTQGRRGVSSSKERKTAKVTQMIIILSFLFIYNRIFQNMNAVAIAGSIFSPSYLPFIVPTEFLYKLNDLCIVMPFEASNRKGNRLICMIRLGLGLG